MCVRVAHRRHQLSLFTACAGMKDCSRLNVRSTELELRRSYSAQQTISTGLCPRSGRPPFVKQQARLAGPTLSELASVSGARRSAIQPSRARRRLADDTKGLPGLEGPPEANRLLAPGHSRALLLFCPCDLYCGGVIRRRVKLISVTPALSVLPSRRQTN